jgi:hypothetical protein
MMEFASREIDYSAETFRDWLETVSFIALISVLAFIIYFDDIQIVTKSIDEAPTIFNVRVMGIKIMDFMTVGLIVLCLACIFFRDRIAVTIFHKNIAWMFLTYWYAGIVGVCYSFFLDYDYRIWIQDFQQILYLALFFLLTFHLVNTKRRWNVFVVCFIGFLAAKNIIIFYRTFHGEGKVFGDWAIRASQNSEFSYFPMMFFPVLIVFLKNKSTILKIFLFSIIFVYLFNAFVGVVRTVWVMLGIGFIYLFFQLERSARIKLVLWPLAIGVIALLTIAAILPRFLTMAWSYKFFSIFSWSIYGDRSNAIRTLEIINVGHYVFDHFSFLQGRGLGSWWDDSTRRLLAAGASTGFMYKTRFYNTHMYCLTQLLKLGAIATGIFWFSFYKMFRHVKSRLDQVPWNQWEKYIVLGLNIGLLCGVISSADFVRLFLMMGVSLGICASYFELQPQPSFR